MTGARRIGRLWTWQKWLTITAFAIALMSFASGQEQQPSDRSQIPHPDFLAWVAWGFILALLGVIGWMLRVWYVSLESWRRELGEKVSNHEGRLVAVETRCEINHSMD